MVGCRSQLFGFSKMKLFKRIEVAVRASEKDHTVHTEAREDDRSRPEKDNAGQSQKNAHRK
jgi:hypothetical protein